MKIKKEFRRSSAPPPPWIDLPKELTTNILSRLGIREILDSAQLVCKTWRRVSLDPAMWRVVDLNLSSNESDNLAEMGYGVGELYFHAVERSKGELIEINIQHFCGDQLLYRISSLPTKLRRLTLAHCHTIKGQALCIAVKRFPELEELHLFDMSSIYTHDIDAIGYACPKLKSFTFNCRGYTHPCKNDQQALAVAKSMPNLCHLRFFGNEMTNEGLQAILDCCPKLESLDIRQCFNVVLEGDLEKRCLDQLITMRRPNDSTADYEYDDTIYPNGPITDPEYLAWLVANPPSDYENEDDDFENDNDMTTSDDDDDSVISGDESVFSSSDDDDDSAISRGESVTPGSDDDEEGSSS